MVKQSRLERRFLFRCDISPETGTGHLRRCLALAGELKKYGASVSFACRCANFDLARELCQVTDDWKALDWSLTPEDDVQEVIRLYRQQGMEAAVIDHYRAAAEYQERLCNAGVRWLQFDWSARQPLWADWVLNASPAAEESVYMALKQRSETCLLLGPAYALLRHEFYEWRPQARFREQVRKILLTFGGGDDRGAILFCLRAMKALEPSIERIVLVSSANPGLSDIMDWVGRNDNSNIKLQVDAPEIARHMAQADLAINAGGTTTFETATMGLPSLIVQINDNQAPNASAWEQAGVAIDAGLLSNLNENTLGHQVMVLVNNPGLRRSMADKGRALIDCLGAGRVARSILS